jgi:hypothetical protein
MSFKSLVNVQTDIAKYLVGTMFFGLTWCGAQQVEDGAESSFVYRLNQLATVGLAKETKWEIANDKPQVVRLMCPHQAHAIRVIIG